MIARALRPVPGAGFEPARPRGGHLILSQARMTNFATPASLSVAWSRAGSRKRNSLGSRSGT
jgi:hypothetical protein